MPAQRLVILATANLFIHHSHNLCLAKSKLWSRQTTLALLPCKPSLGHEGGVLVGFLSPTPTTCRCPSACWAARKFVDAKGPDAWTMQLSRASSGQAHKERMAEPPRTRKTARCACGSVELEAIGTPITSVACYCESCQEGSRQIEALPNRRAVCAIDGGTAYVLYRKDRVEYPKGSRLLRGFKLRDDSYETGCGRLLRFAHVPRIRKGALVDDLPSGVPSATASASSAASSTASPSASASASATAAVEKLPDSSGSMWMALPAALALMGCGIGAMLLVRRRLT